MKKIYQLQSLLNIILWFSMLIISLAVLSAIVAVMMQDSTSLNLSLRGHNLEKVDAALGILLALMLFGYVLFIWALYQLKQLLGLFVERKFFTPEVVATLKKTGWLLLYAAALLYIPPYIYDTVVEANLNISLSSVNPESFFFLIIISLFFVTLSYIFEEAIKLKEENELTV
ncbi:MAG TPA: DUF2975 domain-containing protein [Flavobacterium sp.]|jgi:hypothetical protein